MYRFVESCNEQFYAYQELIVIGSSLYEDKKVVGIILTYYFCSFYINQNLLRYHSPTLF